MITSTVASLNVAICVVAWLVLVRFRRGPALSPFSVAILLLGSIFGVRPIIIDAEGGDWWLYGVNVGAGVELAAIVGLWAIIALIAGYAFSFTRARVRDTEPAGVATFRAPSLRGAAAISLVCSGVWFLSMAVIGGGVQFLQQLAAGRSAEIAARLEGVPVFFSAIPVAGVVVVCVARAAHELSRPVRAGESVLFWAAVASASFPPLALGNRRLLIPVALCALLVVLRGKWRRPITPAAGVFVAAAALIVAALPFVRSAGSRTASGSLVDALVAFFSENGIGETVRSFFVSYDTEMFSYIALVGPHLGDDIEYGLGRGTIGELLLQPIPASLAPWPTWSNSLLTSIFGGGCATVACPVPSVVGILFFDTGLVGVVLGMFFLGLALAGLERQLVRAQGVTYAVALGFAGFVPGLIRGNTISQTWIVANVVIIAVAIIAVSSRARRHYGLGVTRQSGAASRNGHRRELVARRDAVPLR